MSHTYLARHVFFDESLFPFQSGLLRTPPRPHLFCPTTNNPPRIAKASFHPKFSSFSTVGPLSFQLVTVYLHSPITSSSPAIPLNPTNPSSSSTSGSNPMLLVDLVSHRTNLMRMRSQANIFTPKQFNDGTYTSPCQWPLLHPSHLETQSPHH